MQHHALIHARLKSCKPIGVAEWNCIINFLALFLDNSFVMALPNLLTSSSKNAF